MVMTNQNTTVHSGGRWLDSMIDISVSWNDCGWATVRMLGFMPKCIEHFDALRDCGEVCVLYDNDDVLFTIHSIGAIETFMDNIIASGPERVEQLTMGITFSGQMDFKEF